LQLHNLPTDCARELFIKFSKDSENLVSNKKECQVLDFSFFVGDIRGIGLILFDLRISGPRSQPQEICRLKSESFEPLISFLRFLVQKLWLKNVSLDKNYPKSFIYPNFRYFTSDLILN